MSNHLPVSAASLNFPASAATRAEILPLANDILSEIYKQSVPAFASTALDQLQGSLYASSRYLQLSDPDSIPPNTWVGYRGGEIVGVLLFRVNGKCASVLCEVVTLDSAQIDAFARSVFSNFPGVGHITFHAVSLSRPPCSLPSQFFPFSENYVLTLPASAEAYMSRLGKSTRHSVRGYRNRLLRDFPDFRWTSFTCDELTSEQQRQLVFTLQQFKYESMTARGKSPVIDNVETQHFLAMAAECGLFGIASVNGRICAGAFSCRIGNSYVMLLSASDPAMSAYRLGLLTCLWSVADCIDRGGQQCHMLWGRYQYKHQLLAVPKVLYHLTVYPSIAQMLRQPLTVLQTGLHGHFVRGIQCLHHQLDSPQSPGWQWIHHQILVLKKIRSMIRKKFTWMNSRNQEVVANRHSASDANQLKDHHWVSDVTGTATRSRCPMRVT